MREAVLAAISIAALPTKSSLPLLFSMVFAVMLAASMVLFNTVFFDLLYQGVIEPFAACPFCGRELVALGQYCPHCGSQLSPFH